MSGSLSLDRDVIGRVDFADRAECLGRLRELNLITKIKTVRFLTTSHMVRYFVGNFWTALDEDWQRSLLQLSDEALAALPTAVLPQECESESFLEFVERVRKAILPRSQSPVAETLLANQPGYFVDHQMSPKKSHEVRLMAALGAALAQEQGIEQVVDVGSGKGYLCETLALQHHLTVVGVDASETNVHGAERRTNLLRRYYNGLERRAARLSTQQTASASSGAQSSEASSRQGHSNGTSTSTADDVTADVTARSTSPCDAAAQHPAGKRVCAPGGSAIQHDSPASSAVLLCEVNVRSATSATAATESLPVSTATEAAAPCKADLTTAAEMSGVATPTETTAGLSTVEGECAPADTASQSSSRILCTNHTCAGEEGAESSGLDQTAAATAAASAPDSSHAHAQQDDSGGDSSLLSGLEAGASPPGLLHSQKKYVSQPSHTPVVGLVQHDEDDFMAFLEERSQGRVTGDKALLLVGLHTCGNLASTSLRLFAHCPNLQALCTVGCCYHALTESQEAEDANADGSVEDRCYKIATPRDDWRGKGGDGPLGFPLSRLAEELQPQLGVNARMLACQAPDRMRSPGQPPSHLGIFWRAVFQVMLVEKFGRDNFSRGNNVGRQTAKSKSFLDYVRRCMRKLEIEDSAISDQEVEEFHQRFLPRHRELQAFAQLRAMISAVAESMIIVDRVAFLLEQPNVATACAVPLFDPVTSPRNLVLIATKKRQPENGKE